MSNTAEIQVRPSLLDTLVERLSSEEGLEVEFKSAKGGLPVSLWPTVSAFANTRGGWIVLGVNHDEATNEVTIQGVTNPPAMLRNFYNSIRNSQKVSVSVCGADDARVESLGNYQVIIIRVPAAPRRLRPVYINSNPYGGTYLRRNSGDYSCTKPEVDRMMREASDVAADSAVLKYYTWDDLDETSLLRYRRLFQTRDPASPWNSYDNLTFLKAIGGYKRDREANTEGITVAGLLLIGKPEPLRDWRSRHILDYQLTSDEATGDLRWEDRLTWEGNLLDGYLAIYRRLVEGIRVPFRLQSGIRVDQSPVHVALREALVNLLVHADYSETQASLIERSSDSFLFRNPGNSRVLETDLLIGGRSDPRNPELVRMFRLAGLAEEAGTGIPRIIKTWRELGLHLPPIDLGTERYEFMIKLRMAHLLSEEDRTWLNALGEYWSQEEQMALVIAKHEGDVDNPRLRKLTGLHMYDATKVLGSLRDRLFLSKSRVGRSVRYELGPKAGFSDNLGTLGVSSGGNGVSSGGNGVSSEAIIAQLNEIAAPARNQRRLSAATRDKIILQLCAYTPISLFELANLMNRNIDYIREAVHSLIKQRRRSYLYPEQPTHPQQRYIAIQPALDGQY